MYSLSTLKMEEFLIKEAPPTLYYIPNFINAEEEEHILAKVNNAPKPKWTYLSHRRLQNWGGNPMPKGMIPEPLPDWLKFYVDQINNLDVFPITSKANHVLVNEYLSGQGIMPHEDGPLFYPTIVTLNCGSHTVLKFQKKGDDNIMKICLEPRSLVIIKNSLYEDYLHSIEEIESDKMDEIVNLDKTSYKKGETIQRNTRISLTIRNVPKTCKFKLNIFK